MQCPNCRAAVAIGEGGLALLPAQYVASTKPEPLAWLPFWVYRSKVTIRERQTQGGRSAEKDALEFWERPRQVYVPAWEGELGEARDVARRMLEKQPFMEAIIPPEGASFQPAVFTSDDAQKLLELVIVSIEANRNDWMETLNFDLRLDSEALWLLPAERNEDGWKLLVKNF
jgi:hypothetical protein